MGRRGGFPGQPLVRFRVAPASHAKDEVMPQALLTPAGAC